MKKIKRYYMHEDASYSEGEAWCKAKDVQVLEERIKELEAELERRK